MGLNSCFLLTHHTSVFLMLKAEWVLSVCDVLINCVSSNYLDFFFLEVFYSSLVMLFILLSLMHCLFFCSSYVAHVFFLNTEHAPYKRMCYVNFEFIIILWFIMYIYWVECFCTFYLLMKTDLSLKSVESTPDRERCCLV